MNEHKITNGDVVDVRFTDDRTEILIAPPKGEGTLLTIEGEDQVQILNDAVYDDSTVVFSVDCEDKSRFCRYCGERCSSPQEWVDHEDECKQRDFVTGQVKEAEQELYEAVAKASSDMDDRPGDGE